MSIAIYGASDDLIEVDGDISEEFTYRNDENDANEGDLLGFSDGTILRIAYTRSGVWRISPIVRGAARLEIEQAPEDDDRNYSDKATLDSAVWVMHGVSWTKALG